MLLEVTKLCGFHAVRDLEMRESVLDGRSKLAGPVTRGDQQLQAEQLDFITRSASTEITCFTLHHTNAYSIAEPALQWFSMCGPKSAVCDHASA